MTQDFFNRRTRKRSSKICNGSITGNRCGVLFPIEYRQKENKKNMYLFALQGESVRVCLTTEHVIMMW